MASTHIDTSTHTHTYTHASTHMHAHTYTHRHTHVHVWTYTHTYLSHSGSTLTGSSRKGRVKTNQNFLTSLGTPLLDPSHSPGIV